MIIHGLNKLTLLDYPEHMACLVFTGGCNFRCPFCQNAGLVLNPGSQPVISEEEVFSLLRKRKGVLEGVVITGGEPTLNADLCDFAAKAKAEGYLLKLDTNGTSPETVKKLIDAGLVDYIAMDIKNSPEKYARTAGIGEETGFLEKIRETVAIIKASGIDYEFRTTVVKELHTAEDLNAIGEFIGDAKTYVMQPFRDCDSLVGAKEGEFHAPDTELLKEAAERLKKNIKTVVLRGI